MYLVLGDSHAEVFNHANARLSGHPFDVRAIGGATAQGALNPNSKTNAMTFFEEYIEQRHSLHRYCVVMLGEVDCGFVIWHYREKYGVPLLAQFNRSTRNFMEFVDRVVAKYFTPADIFVCGVVPPVIKDNTDKRYLTGARSQVAATRAERTRLTRLYNDKLSLECRRRGVNFISIFARTVRDGVVADEFLNEDPFDHHLSPEKTYGLWLDELGRHNDARPGVGTV
jgi:hypothetical protein